MSSDSYILIPRKCPRKTLFQHTVPPLLPLLPPLLQSTDQRFPAHLQWTIVVIGVRSNRFYYGACPWALVILS